MGIDLVEIWDHMSIIVKVITVGLLLMSVFMFYIIAERLLTFRAASDESIRYVQGLGEYLRQHKVNEALNSARSMKKSPVAKVMEAGLVALIAGREALKTHGPDDVGNFDLVDSVNRALERVKERETSNLRTGMAFLGTTATTTPFIGLLGTVIGILGTFQLLRGGTVTINEIGPKISEALVATALGLGVAIIAAMAFNFFTARVEQYVIDMNDVSSEFIDYVLKEGRA
ncbi:MAG: MotA/TolQ/ExbB proton channel family protein [Deltaproteobacteria bacterium]|nr:MotA/TolQ/ExbB proton channel family protein [Deltaproteobacteria bacterium]MDQ3299956.1 MotA/TolQ/ExbB proton channel family protein [Myxococcota bacterium]